jgi:hypothetical protein
MPNSRLEISAYLVQVAVADAWKVTGNSVANGQLGTNSFDHWYFISSGVKRGGHFANGERFLQTHGPTFDKSELVEKTVTGTSVNAVPITLFSLSLDDTTVWNFNANVQARRSSGLDRGVFERKVMAYREGGGAVLGKEHSLFTDKSTGYSLVWQTSGNLIELIATGVSGHTVYWTATVFYQGVKTS